MSSENNNWDNLPSNEGLRLLILKTSEFITMIHQALKPFATVIPATKESNPAYSRMAELFFKLCSARFTAITTEANDIVTSTRAKDFSFPAAFNRYQALESDIWSLIDILTVTETRNQYDI